MPLAGAYFLGGFVLSLNFMFGFGSLAAAVFSRVYFFIPAFGVGFSR